MDYIFPIHLEVKMTELEQVTYVKSFKLLTSCSDLGDARTLPCPFLHTLIHSHMKHALSPTIISHVCRVY